MHGFPLLLPKSAASVPPPQPTSGVTALPLTQLQKPDLICFLPSHIWPVGLAGLLSSPHKLPATTWPPSGLTPAWLQVSQAVCLLFCPSWGCLQNSIPKTPLNPSYRNRVRVHGASRCFKAPRPPCPGTPSSPAPVYVCPLGCPTRCHFGC